MKAIIIGAGLSGLTAARILKNKGWAVEVFEKRNHIGGNCYDSNLCGTLVHNYGPHIFHTNDEEVFSFLSQFTEWTPFSYKPKGESKLGIISLPYSKKTIAEIGKTLSPDEIIKYIFKDYSEKQWGVPFDQISKSIISRIPKVSDEEDPTWYGSEKYQCLPSQGYTEMFKRMADGINIEYNANLDLAKKNYEYDLLIYTGAIDEYFNYCFGELPYRTLTFKHTITQNKLNNVVYNQNNPWNQFTRKYDHSYFTPNHSGMTCITEEYPKQYRRGDIPFYPITFGDSVKIYNQYKQLSNLGQFKKTIFLGRLATYKYLDMWMAVKQVMVRLKDL